MLFSKIGKTHAPIITFPSSILLVFPYYYNTAFASKYIKSLG